MKYRIPPSPHARSDNYPIIYVVLVILLWLLAGVMNSQVKTSTVSGNWNNPAIWTPYGVPAASDKIHIFHTVTLNQNFSPNDTIFVYNVLNIGSNNVLTLSTGILVLVNTASYDGRLGTVGNNGKIVGDFIFQKWISRCDGFSMYGTPFNVLVGDLDWYYCYQCMPGWSNLYYYNEKISGNMNLGYYDTIGGALERGKGFSYWYSNYTGGPNFSRKISLKGNIDFTKEFDFNISRTSSGSATDDGFNLVANPFPGTIDWLSSDWTRKKTGNAIYVWNTCSNNYGAYVNGIGVNGGSRYIPSMQAFWVQATQSNPQLKIKSGAMSNNAQNLNKNSLQNDSVTNLLRLSLNGDEIAVRLDPDATQEQDSLQDALKFFSEASSICSSVNSGTLDFSINSVKDTNCVITIKTKGSGVLNLGGVKSFSSRFTIRLKDLATHQWRAVTEDMQYSFADTSLVTFQKRFELEFREVILTSIKNSLETNTLVWYDQEYVHIKLNAETQLPAIISMYDLSGKLVYSGTAQQAETTIARQNIPVVLRIQNLTECVTKKVF